MTRPRHRSVFQVGVAFVAMTAVVTAVPQSPPDAATVLADRMLDALGGRTAWASATSLVNDSQQNRVEAPTKVRTTITLDLTRTRFRIETTAPGLHLVRVVDGESGWRRTRDGVIEDLPDAVRSADLRWYAGHVYRTIHRVARRDPSVRLAIGRGGRLDVFEGDLRIAWYQLDAAGEPVSFGGLDDDVVTLSGPWVHERQGIRHPLWVARPDGSWRAHLVSLEVNVPMDASVFRRPPR